MKAASLYHKNWRVKNPLVFQFHQRARYIRRYQLLRRLKNKPCMDCQGWFDHWQMEFDHREHKEFNISSGLALPMEKLLAEIKKCDVVCANCHKTRTFQRQQQGNGSYREVC